MKKSHLLYLIVILLISTNLQAKSPYIKLDKSEKRFKKIKDYKLKDFNFNWNINYMDIVNYDVKSSDKIHFSLLPKVKFYTVIKVGKKVKFPMSKQVWLAEALLKKDYFWKQMLMPPGLMYSFTTLRFLENGDKRFKAVSQLEDIKEMIEPIDTEAKLYLWLLVKEEGSSHIYSYKKIKNLYRVRFSVSSLGCYYTEYFKFYDQKGMVVESKKIKEHRIKNCNVIMP